MQRAWEAGKFKPGPTYDVEYNPYLDQDINEEECFVLLRKYCSPDGFSNWLVFHSFLRFMNSAFLGAHSFVCPEFLPSLHFPARVACFNRLACRHVVVPDLVVGGAGWLRGLRVAEGRVCGTAGGNVQGLLVACGAAHCRRRGGC